MLSSYLKYRLQRVSDHKVHSPFVFDFYQNILKKGKDFDDSEILRLRKKISSSSDEVSVTDYGAGSKRNLSEKRLLSEMVKSAAIPPKYGELLATIVRRYGCKQILELGTSVGIGSAYLAMANKDASVRTLEGCPNLAKIAEKNFNELGLTNIEIFNGEFSELLEQSVKGIENFDLIYIDGNHTYEATLKYFNFYRDYVHDDTFIIFDDIHWSRGMEKAWEEIISSSDFNVSIDLFRLGIICKRPGQAKEDFVLKF